MIDTPHIESDTPPTCGDCIHSQHGPNTVNNVFSRACYRYPPTPIGFMSPQGFIAACVRPEVLTGTIACGEFEVVDDDGSDDQTLMLPGLTL